MAGRHARFAASQKRLILAFVLLLLVPATAVVWLGVRLVEQDRALAARQLRERREGAADRILARLEQRLSSIERRLDGAPEDVPIGPDDDAVLVRLRPAGIQAYPSDHLLYLPTIPPGPAEPAELFEAGEALEFRARDYRGAAEAFRALAASPSAAVEAGALLRLARTLKKSGHLVEALRVYADLARVGGARLSGVPAELVARRARCSLLDELGRDAELDAEARSLQIDLVGARWAIDRGTFLAYLEQATRWTSHAQLVDAHRYALSAATEWMWSRWVASDRGELHGSGRHALRFDGVAVTMLWQSSSDGLVALVAGPQFQQRAWFDGLQSDVNAPGLPVALVDADGQAVLGALPTDLSATERRNAAETRLPWAIYVRSADDAADRDELANRRALLLAGLAILLTLVFAGAYFMGSWESLAAWTGTQRLSVLRSEVGWARRLHRGI